MTAFDPKRRDLVRLTAATGGAVAAAGVLPAAAPPAAAQEATGKRIRELPATPDKLL